MRILLREYYCFEDQSEASEPGNGEAKYPLEVVEHHILDDYIARLNSREPPVFAKQGEMAGKRRGRKPKQADKEATTKGKKNGAKNEKKRKAGKKAAKRKRSARSSKAAPSSSSETSEDMEAWKQWQTSYGSEWHAPDWEDGHAYDSGAWEWSGYDGWENDYDGWACWEESDYDDWAYWKEDYVEKPGRKRAKKDERKSSSSASKAVKKNTEKPPAGKRPRVAAKKGEEEIDLPKPPNAKAPPPHVTVNMVYSSAYRKAMGAHRSKDEARKAGKEATFIFKTYGVVDERCGEFRKPRTKKVC